MKTASSLTLLAIGAILTFAVLAVFSTDAAARTWVASRPKRWIVCGSANLSAIVQAVRAPFRAQG